MKEFRRSIVLKRFAFGESDWIVCLFTRDFGKLSGMAKAARNSTKRFGGAFEPGTVADVLFSDMHGANLVRLEEARVLVPPNNILQSLERINALSAAINLVINFLQERQSAPEKFDLLEERLKEIGSTEPDYLSSIRFELEWLKYCGFAPRLNSCVVCNNEEQVNGWEFDFDQGGVICDRCSCKIKNDNIVRGDTVDNLVQFDRSGQMIPNAKAASGVVRKYIDHVIGKKIMRDWLEDSCITGDLRS